MEAGTATDPIRPRLGRASGSRPRPPAWLAGAAALVALAAALPLVYLLIVVGGDPAGALEVIARPRSLALLRNSVGLAAAVTAASVALALPLAWLTVRTDLPARRIWTVATVLPLVVPSYIGAYAFLAALGPRGIAQDLLGVERLPSIYGFPGTFAVLTLFTYPLVLLTVRAALRGLDPQIEEAARGMGRSRWSTFRSVVLPQLVPATAAGALLVALYVLSDFGAVSILRFESFTRAIFVAYSSSFDRTAGAALAAMLVAVMLVVLYVDGRVVRRSGLHRAGPGSARPAAVVPLGRWRVPALLFCAAVVLIALVVPLGVLVYWSIQGVAGEVDLGAVAAGAGRSLLAAGLTAAVTALCALPLAVLSVRFPGRFARGAERLGYTGYALPGVVVALALVFLGTRIVLPLYQTLAMLVFALAILFLPQAYGATRAAIGQISPRVEEAARSAGRSPFGVLRTITAPLASSGILAGVALVFLTTVKELPATLILAPIGFDTLATKTWRATTIGFYERGAAPALALLAISAVPLYLLTLRDR